MNALTPGPCFIKVAMTAVSAGMATFFIISQSGRRITPVVMEAANPAQVCYNSNFYETGPKWHYDLTFSSGEMNEVSNSPAHCWSTWCLIFWWMIDVTGSPHTLSRRPREYLKYNGQNEFKIVKGYVF